MPLNYQGTVFEITSDFQTAFNDIITGGEPQGIPVPSGQMIVQFINRSGNINNGAFRVSAPDDAEIMNGYRFHVSCTIIDPCRSLRIELRQLQRRLKIARLDNAVSEIEFLEREVARASNELDSSELENQVIEINFALPQFVFRSTNIFRSAKNERTIRDLKIYFKRLNKADIEFIADSSSNDDVKTIFSNEDLTSLAQAKVTDPALEIFRVFTAEERLRVDFKYTRVLTVTGSIFLNVDPSRSHDFRKNCALGGKWF